MSCAFSFLTFVSGCPYFNMKHAIIWKKNPAHSFFQPQRTSRTCQKAFQSSIHWRTERVCSRSRQRRWKDSFGMSTSRTERCVKGGKNPQEVILQGFFVLLCCKLKKFRVVLFVWELSRNKVGDGIKDHKWFQDCRPFLQLSA